MDLLVLTIIVVMGVMGGGMLALTLMAPRPTQNIFALLLGIAVVLGLAAAAVSTLDYARYDHSARFLAVLSLNLMNLALAGVLGYAVTTLAVLGRGTGREADPPVPPASGGAAGEGSGRTAVLYLAPGEPPAYDARRLARVLEIESPLTGRPGPPFLLRPLALRRLNRLYAAAGGSAARETHVHLAEKVQDRLGRRVHVYICYDSDQPAPGEAAAAAIGDGARRLIVLHPRLVDPPAQISLPRLLGALRPERSGATLIETAPLWDSDLLARLFVRRAQAAVPAEQRAQAGLLLVGHGYPDGSAVAGTELAPDPAQHRQHEEAQFQKRVRQGLIKGGFGEDRIVIGWLYRSDPALGAALAQLRATGADPIYWLGTGLTAEDLAARALVPRALAAAGAPPPQSLGVWGDDDPVADVLADAVKTVLPADAPARVR